MIRTTKLDAGLYSLQFSFVGEVFGVFEVERTDRAERAYPVEWDVREVISPDRDGAWVLTVPTLRDAKAAIKRIGYKRAYEWKGYERS